MNNYFAYDLRRAWYNGGFSALCVGILPLISYLFGTLFYLVGMMDSLPSYELTLTMLPIAIIIYVLIFPAKLYGEVTDRRAGSNFLMLPASTGKKFTSLLLILVVILPVSIAILFVCSDLILSLIPSYDGGVFKDLINIKIPGFNVGQLFGKGHFSESLIAISTIEQCINTILFFTLGALIFKRKKTGKTILSYLVVMLVIALIVFSIANHILGGIDETEWNISETGIAIIINIINISAGVLLGFFVYRRLKKIEL